LESILSNSKATAVPSSSLPYGELDLSTSPKVHNLSQMSSITLESARLNLAKVLSKSRFPVLLVEDKDFPQSYALKLFPMSKGSLPTSFLNEILVLNLEHDNLIELQSAFPQFSLESNSSQPSSISAILMEYALHGDLCNLLRTASKDLSEEAVRTLFHQLLDGLEYLHSQGLAHLDLKPDNLLLGEDFTLKIGDFDQVTPIQDSCTTSKGTPGYRAPEVKRQTCKNLCAADIFSAGVVLFIMKSRVPPYAEGKLFALYNELIKEKNSRFWEIHCQAKKDKQFFSESFKDLFTQMLQPVPENRPSISEIKKSEWYNGPTLDQKSLKEELSRL
jgi:serine/threonine protein kinase